MELTFEQGPIWPPSEAQSLLIRVTRNCPWNRCAFCYAYQGCDFELKSVEDVKKDIQTAGYCRSNQGTVLEDGGREGGSTDPWSLPFFPTSIFTGTVSGLSRPGSITGGELVFLQDANSLILKMPDLVEILRFIKEKFPLVSRITSYCRSKTAKRKTVEELKQIRGGGAFENTHRSGDGV
jgi:hypothetical protein